MPRMLTPVPTWQCDLSWVPVSLPSHVLWQEVLWLWQCFASTFTLILYYRKKAERYTDFNSLIQPQPWHKNQKLSWHGGYGGKQHWWFWDCICRIQLHKSLVIIILLLLIQQCLYTLIYLYSLIIKVLLCKHTCLPPCVMLKYYIKKSLASFGNVSKCKVNNPNNWDKLPPQNSVHYWDTESKSCMVNTNWWDSTVTIIVYVCIVLLMTSEKVSKPIGCCTVYTHTLVQHKVARYYIIEFQ